MQVKSTEKETNADSTDEVEEFRVQSYDAVIIATPLTKDMSDIRFINTTRDFQFSGKYERIHATFVEGKLRNPTFNLKDSEVVDDILITKDDLVYNSIGKQLPIDLEQCSDAVPQVYKLFSPSTLTDEQLQVLFTDIKSNKEVVWSAYPHYDFSVTEAPFELQPGLYYNNAIEWAGSAMEMSAIAAKNAALLTLKYLTGDPKAGNIMVQRDEL